MHIGWADKPRRWLRALSPPPQPPHASLCLCLCLARARTLSSLVPSGKPVGSADFERGGIGWRARLHSCPVGRGDGGRDVRSSDIGTLPTHPEPLSLVPVVAQRRLTRPQPVMSNLKLAELPGHVRKELDVVLVPRSVHEERWRGRLGTRARGPHATARVHPGWRGESAVIEGLAVRHRWEGTGRHSGSLGTGAVGNGAECQGLAGRPIGRMRQPVFTAPYLAPPRTTHR